MSDYREGCIHAKKVRAGIVDQRTVPGRAKKAMPIILESRPIKGTFAYRVERSEWRKWAAYRSVREAEQARDNLSRKYSTIWEFRVKPLAE
jgi:hypothetical protein